MKFSLVFLVLAVAASVCAQKEDFYCGRHLAKTMAIICYNPMTMLVKRSEQIGAPLGTPYGAQYGTFPWLGAAEARSLGRGKRDGIADECCAKSCTIEELLTYC